jgi:hypothetical protein
MRRPRAASKLVKLQSPYEGHRVQSLPSPFRTRPSASSELKTKRDGYVAESVKACTGKDSIA